MICFYIIAFFVLVAVFAPLISPYDPNATDLSNKLGSSTLEHLLGTDEYGRDILSRIIYGARVSLSIGLISTMISTFIGVVLGVLAGYYGGIVDEIICRIMEVFSAFPDILFAIAIMFIFGPGVINLFIALGILGWVSTARLIRGQALSIKGKEYIKAARASGASDFFIIIKHILPNCISTIIVISTMSIPGAIMSEASLSFLGLGVQSPTASWGSMISYAKSYIRTAPAYSIYPGIAIILIVLAFNLFGDSLRDALDPKLKI